MFPSYTNEQLTLSTSVIGRFPSSTSMISSCSRQRTIYTRYMWPRYRHLLVIQRESCAWLRVNSSKEKIGYLGHVIKASSLEVVLDMIEAISKCEIAYFCTWDPVFLGTLQRLPAFRQGFLTNCSNPEGNSKQRPTQKVRYVFDRAKWAFEERKS